MLVDCSPDGFEDALVVGKTEVVVAAKAKDLAPVHHDARSLSRADLAQASPQPGRLQFIQRLAKLLVHHARSLADAVVAGEPPAVAGPD